LCRLREPLSPFPLRDVRIDLLGHGSGPSSNGIAVMLRRSTDLLADERGTDECSIYLSTTHGQTAG